MILQFIGFFVVFCSGGLATFCACYEFYNGITYRSITPLKDDDLIEIAIYIVAIFVGCGLMYYAGTHAPFEISFTASLKN